jgi:hypothetical protein
VRRAVSPVKPTRNTLGRRDPRYHPCRFFSAAARGNLGFVAVKPAGISHDALLHPHRQRLQSRTMSRDSRRQTALLTLFVLRHGGLRSMRNPHLAATLLVLLTASHLVYFGGPRFHHPMMPRIALLTGSILAGAMRAVTELWAGHRRRQRKPVV